MEARSTGTVTLAAAALFVLATALVCAESYAAGYRTANFTVSAPTPELAREIGDAAEKFRKELAVEWLGKEMPDWSRPCPITAQVRPGLGAGGATSFLFDRGHVYGWRMQIQGSRERILDSVLPHEVTHTIFASHFRQKLPRWADEGACTTVEHRSEKAKHQHMLIRFLKTKQGIPFSQLFAMKEYPANVMPLYSQGYSVARYLIEQGGKRKFLEFIADGLEDENWPRAVREQYGYENLWALQNTWLDWVRDGSPQLSPQSSAGALVAKNDPRAPARPGMIYRAQSEDRPPARLASASSEAAARRENPRVKTEEPTSPADAKLVPVRRTSGSSVYSKSAQRNTPTPSNSQANSADQAKPKQTQPEATAPKVTSLASAPLRGEQERSTEPAVAPAGRRTPKEDTEVLIEWKRDSSAAAYDSRLPTGTVWR